MIGKTMLQHRMRATSVIFALALVLNTVARLVAASAPGTTSNSTPGVLLYTTFDNVEAITTPATGVGGTTTLEAADFVPAQVGNGAHFSDANKVVTFPAANGDGSVQNIELGRGEVEFWYRPNYNADDSDDVGHHMLVLGNVDNVPHMILTESDSFKLTFTDASWNSYTTQAGWRASLWEAGEWVHIRATWDTADPDPLRLYVNGERVDGGGAANGWDLGAETDFGAIFVGAGNAEGVFSADGVIDELIIRDAPQPPAAATPTNTSTATPTAAGASPTATPTAAGGSPTATPTPTPTTAGGVGITDPDRVVTPAALPLQPAGTPFVDPVFGTTLRRVSDTSDSGGFETHEYSQLQAFSADNVYLLLDGSNGFVVRRVSDLSLVAGLDTSEWNAPRWHPAQSHTIVHFDTNADTVVRLQFTNVDTLATNTVFTFPSQYERIRSNQSFDELSEDGRWLAGMVTQGADDVLFALDIQNRTLGAVLPISELYAGPCQPDPQWGELRPDWVGVSPLGNYLVVQWERDGTERCSGLETFDIQTGAFVGRVYEGHQHGDLGVDSDGATEFFMTFELAAPPPNNNFPAIGMRRLPGTETASEPTYLQVTGWFQSHISCQGPQGVCLVTMSRDENEQWEPFENELFLQYTDGSVQRLVHHRSSSCGYWVQPRASISRDGSYVVFASDWGRELDCDDLGRGDPYIIDLSAGTTPTPTNTATSTATATPTSTPTGTPGTPAVCPADVDGNGSVNMADVQAVVEQWHQDNPPSEADVNEDGEVNILDIMAVVAQWGQPCDAATSTATATATATPTSTPTNTPTTTSTPTATTPPSTGANFTYQLIDDQIIHGQGMTVVDIDQDGDQDVVAALSLTDAVYLYVNGGDSNGSGDGSSWASVSISGDGTIVAMQTAVADFDDDGDLDVAAVGLFDRDCTFCSAGEVAWYENPGNVLGTWPPHSIHTNLWGLGTSPPLI